MTNVIQICFDDSKQILVKCKIMFKSQFDFCFKSYKIQPESSPIISCGEKLTFRQGVQRQIQNEKKMMSAYVIPGK